MNTTADAIAALSGRFLLDHPALAAKAIEDLPQDEVIELLSEQPVHILKSLWPHFLPNTADELLPKLATASLQTFLYELDPPECIGLLNRLPKEAREQCFALLPAAYQQQLQTLMSFPNNSAGQESS